MTAVNIAPAEPVDPLPAKPRRIRKPHKHFGKQLRLDDDVALAWKNRRNEMQLLLRLCAIKGITPDSIKELAQDLRDCRTILQTMPSWPVHVSWFGKAIKVISKLLGHK